MSGSVALSCVAALPLVRRAQRHGTPLIRRFSAAASFGPAAAAADAAGTPSGAHRGVAGSVACRAVGSSDAPIAAQRPHRVTFGAVEGENRGELPMDPPLQRDDPWFWLRDDDRESEEVLSHLRAENAYTERETAHLSALRDELYKEHISHLKETDVGPAYRHGPWFYYTRTVKGLSYKIHCRKPGAADAEMRQPADDAQEQVILDENKVAEGKSQCIVDGVMLCPGHDILAYSVDFSGDETYTVVFKDLVAGTELPDTLEGVCGSVEWGGDSKTVYYRTEDDAKRPWKLWRHTLGESQDKDVCLFTEMDELFNLNHGKTTSGRFLIADASSTETSELHAIDLEAGPEAQMVVVQPREFGLRYDLDHVGENFLVWTNKDEAVENKLMRVPVSSVLAGQGGQSSWTEVLPYDPTMHIEGVIAMADFVGIEGRQAGLTQIWVLDGSLEASSLQRLSFEEELYEVEIGTNREPGARQLRIEYCSLTTPRTAMEFEPASGKMERVWRQEVPGLDPSKYECRRIFAEAADGESIPMSVVCLKGVLDAEGPRPCMLYGYGSYGICIDPGFDPHILPYLDRGMVYVLANIRGGGEMGRHWYEEQGKYLTKRNTFLDFVACAEHLIEEGITAPDRLAIEGRSAGGLLVGAVLNMRPDLFRVAVAGVPFVDVMNSMCDPSIPLTTGEWEEWGNPNEWKYFDYMLSYSPYDNVRELPYPDILITAGLFDPRVAYWEPAKWASKLRTNSTNPRAKVLLKMDLEVGHFSASDRYRYKKEKAFEQAVVLEKLGLAGAPPQA